MSVVDLVESVRWVRWYCCFANQKWSGIINFIKFNLIEKSVNIKQVSLCQLWYYLGDDKNWGYYCCLWASHSYILYSNTGVGSPKSTFGSFGRCFPVRSWERRCGQEVKRWEQKEAYGFLEVATSCFQGSNPMVLAPRF